MSDAFGFASADFEEDTVDDAGDSTPFDFQALERKARYNALPGDIKECMEQLKEFISLTDESWQHIFTQCDADDAAVTQLLEYLGAL